MSITCEHSVSYSVKQSSALGLFFARPLCLLLVVFVLYYRFRAPSPHNSHQPTTTPLFALRTVYKLPTQLSNETPAGARNYRGELRGLLCTSDAHDKTLLSSTVYKKVRPSQFRDNIEPMQIFLQRTNKHYSVVVYIKVLTRCRPSFRCPLGPP